MALKETVHTDLKAAMKARDAVRVATLRMLLSELEKAALDKRIIQLIELGEWTEDDAQARVDYVLKSAEHGDADIQLDPVRAPDAPAAGANGEGSPSE